MTNISEIAKGLSDGQRDCIVNCESRGNGHYAMLLYGLAKLELMAMTPVPKLMGAKAYRLTPLGVKVREYLINTNA